MKKGWGPPLRERVLLTVIVTLAVLTVGCHRGPQVRFRTADELLSRIHERTDCSRGVVGDAQVEVAGPFAHYEGQLLFKAAAPNGLRFDLYSDFGVSLAAVASNDRELSFFDLGSNTFVRGAPEACNLARFTQVNVPPFALVELLRGRPPVVEHEPTSAEVRWTDSWFGAGRYEIELLGNHDSREILWATVPEDDWSKSLDEQRVYLTRVRLLQAGREVYEVDLSDYRTAAGANLTPTREELEMGITSHQPTGPSCEAELPRRISFHVGRGGHRLNLIVDEVAHNPPRSLSPFELQVPRGARMVRGSCPK